jgi:nucleoid DNA-binding protein
MDIAKYIGLFLLKNHFCYVHGLGNMELHKRSASFDGKALQAPSYEVKVTPGGSIDDNLANFIAVNEQISISKAANALRDFSIQARKDMAAGKEVPIPNIGNFSEQNGKILFVTDANFQFTPAGIPTIRNSKQLEEQNSKPAQKPSFPPPQKADSINWSMIILVVVLLIIIGGGVYGIYYYMHHNRVVNTVPVAVPVKDTVKPAPVTIPTVTPVPDSLQVHKDSDAITSTPPPPRPIVPNNDTMTLKAYKMVIGDYPTKVKAEIRLKTLRGNGNRVDMIAKDSTNYLIYTTINCRESEVPHIKDSLRVMFGFKGVYVY